LCEGTVAFGAQRPALKRSVIDVTAQHVAYDHPLADPGAIDAVTNGNDDPTAVRTLNTRELHRHTRPGCICIINLVKAVCPTGIGGINDLLRIPANAGIDIGIIDTRC
jgi:hypothetical protein